MTVCEIHAASVRRLGAAHYSWEQIESWAQGPGLDRYVEFLAEAEVYVAERGGAPCGYGLVLPEEGEVQAVYVHADHARQGVGAAILEHLESRARAAGAQRLRLRASLNAEPFYLRAGWRVVERTTHVTRGGLELACVWMEKRLDG